MSRTLPIELIASASFASTGTGAPVFVGRNRSLALVLDVADLATGCTLDIAIETASSRSASCWRSLGAFTQASAAGATTLSLAGADAFVRATWSLSGAARSAFTVGGDAGLVLLASTAIASTSTSTPIDLAQYRAARLTLDVTAASGATPTLTVTIETASSAAALTWRTAGTFTAASAIGAQEQLFSGLDRFVRARCVPSAGATFTASIDGVTELVFASPADRARLGIRGATIPDVTASEEAEALITASRRVAGYYGRYEHPLRSWQDDTSEATVVVADFVLLMNRGSEPGKDSSATSYFTRYKEFVGEPPQRLGWLDMVAKNLVEPQGIVDSRDPVVSTTTSSAGPVVKSLPLRRWGRGGGR
jgi:hypothetical protein